MSQKGIQLNGTKPRGTPKRAAKRRNAPVAAQPGNRGSAEVASAQHRDINGNAFEQHSGSVEANAGIARDCSAIFARRDSVRLSGTNAASGPDHGESFRHTFAKWARRTVQSAMRDKMNTGLYVFVALASIQVFVSFFQGLFGV